MRAQILLSGAAGFIVAAIGLLHAIYTFQDIRRPRYLAPVDATVKSAMEGTKVRITRGQSSVWDVWLGVNLTHSYGLLVVGVAAICLPSMVRGEYLTIVLAAFALLVIVYLATAMRFFFNVPAALLAVATLLMLGALAVQLAAGR